jgi:hypothetical protein
VALRLGTLGRATHHQRLHRAHVITTTSGRNFAPAMLHLTSCSSQKCNNMTPLGLAAGLHFTASPFETVRPVCLKNKSSFQLYKFYIKELFFTFQNFLLFLLGIKS